MSQNEAELTQGKVARARTAAAVARPNRRGRMRMPRVGPWKFLVLWWGKLRRQFQAQLRRGFVRRRHALRRGQCTRCGACCMLGIGCPSLRFDEQGLALCLRYNRHRNITCHQYPVTDRDLRDRDIILPDVPCGFHFAKEAAAADQTADRKA